MDIVWILCREEFSRQDSSMSAAEGGVSKIVSSDESDVGGNGGGGDEISVQPRGGGGALKSMASHI